MDLILYITFLIVSYVSAACTIITCMFYMERRLVRRSGEQSRERLAVTSDGRETRLGRAGDGDTIVNQPGEQRSSYEQRAAGGGDASFI
uniref:Putative secreted protein n=1 Tax=Panstrongylus lignarius TaxID=156445 RepID=A0A224Y2F7_9HEMI